jgi:PRC-barrel domain
MPTPFSSRLRYVDADAIDETIIDFDRLNVRAADGDKLGEVEGFIIDPGLRRAYYIVVDSGGWFSSQHYLVPIGHARVDTREQALRLDVARDAIKSYPEFDPDRFATLTDDDLRRFETRTLAACCPHETPSIDAWGYDRWAHYRQPDWWRSDVAALQSRWQPVARSSFARSGELGQDAAAVGTAGVGDVSPHVDKRAQPGDVLGIETAGETTALGDTKEDEDQKRG